MNKLNSFPEHDFNALKFNAFPDINKLKEELVIKVLRKYLNREPTEEDLLKVSILYRLNSEELIYDNVSLGKFEVTFENNNEDFLRNNFRVVCNSNEQNVSNLSTFPIVT